MIMLWGKLYLLVILEWTPCPEDAYCFPNAKVCRQALGWLNAQERIWEEEAKLNPILWDRHIASRAEFWWRRQVWDTLLGAQCCEEFGNPDKLKQRFYLATLRQLIGDAAYYNRIMPFPMLKVNNGYSD